MTIHAVPGYQLECVFCHTFSREIRRPREEALRELLKEGWSIETQPTVAVCPDCSKERKL